MIKKYRVRYQNLSSGWIISEYCFKKRKEFLWTLHNRKEINIFSCTRAGRGTFWMCLRNDRYLT